MREFEYLLERSKLKRKLFFWRLLSIILIISVIFYYKGDSKMAKEHIARIYISDFLTVDPKIIERINLIAKDNKIKAVLLHVDSSGGTFAGGETIHKAIKKLSKEKPVISIVGDCALSGGYMIAMASNYILARNGSLVGSIGVIMQNFEITDMASKLGINLVTFKSGVLKALPNRFEKLNPEAERHMQSIVDDMNVIFLKMLQENRAVKNIDLISKGGFYTGAQSIDMGLIDGLGEEDDAINILQEKYNIPQEMEILDINISNQFYGFNSEDNILDKILYYISRFLQ